MYRVSSFVRHFAFALISGVLLATLWVTVSPDSYYDVIEWRLFEASLPVWVSATPLIITPLTAVSEGLMALFLAFVGKELWEALILERGALSGRRAFLPAAAMAGGWVGAVVLWLITGALIETAIEATPGVGWAVPIGSDVVLGYLVGRLVFSAGHPALHLLLLLTIGNDIAGLIVLGVVHPTADLGLLWLSLPLVAAFAVWVGFARHARRDLTEVDHRRAFLLWPYVLAGGVSWAGVVLAGLPGALGLLPIIPVIPHSTRAFGLFAEAEEYLHDPLNRLMHGLVKPITLTLFLFGLTRGGIDILAIAPTTLTVLAALWIGKPAGILLGAGIAKALGLPMPAGLRLRHLLLVALLAGIGFTVPVLALDNALPGGGMAEAARVGLALSFLIALPAILLAKALIRTGK